MTENIKISANISYSEFIVLMAIVFELHYIEKRRESVSKEMYLNKSKFGTKERETSFTSAV